MVYQLLTFTIENMRRMIKLQLTIW